MNNTHNQTSVEIDLEDSFNKDTTIDINLDSDVVDIVDIESDTGFEVDLGDFSLPLSLEKKHSVVEEEGIDIDTGVDIHIDYTDELITEEPEKKLVIDTEQLITTNEYDIDISSEPLNTIGDMVNTTDDIVNTSNDDEGLKDEPKLDTLTTTEIVKEASQENSIITNPLSENLQDPIETPIKKEENPEQSEEVLESKPDNEVNQTAANTANIESGSSWFGRMKSGLSKSRKNLADGMMGILIGVKEIDDELFEEVEDQLLVADIGVEATNRIIKNLTEQTDRGDLIYSNSLYKALQRELVDILEPKVKALEITPQTNEAGEKIPFVLLMVGVNGVGKTTTIGKLAKRLQSEGKSVMLAAGDTFRAAATEQLQVWGDRNNIPVVAQGHGSDSASVIFDAMQSAKAKGIDVLIADTAGRLQNKTNLMSELEKVVRVMKKSDINAPHECMIVLDAGTGQNAINQVDLFNQAVNVTGITVTKLDGTAKGGVVFNIANTTDIPIRFIGVGESIDDLRSFKPKEFVEALFDRDE